ncbi:hypothetical protein [Streptomyces abikoensis]|uniref:hypothetical protein n=1 Tax=Streptomyces abikoensis TaxID=97398 RepID=UPI0033E5C3B6
MYPDSDVVPLSVAEIQDALLAFNGRHLPYRVRQASCGETADYVAEWCFQTHEEGQRVERRIRIRMRLDASRHEVRSFQEQWTSASGRLSMSHEYSRGSGFVVRWTYERGPDGRRHKVVSLDTRDMRNSLRKMFLSSGWAWRGVSKASGL